MSQFELFYGRFVELQRGLLPIELFMFFSRIFWFEVKLNIKEIDYPKCQFPHFAYKKCNQEAFT